MLAAAALCTLVALRRLRDRRRHWRSNRVLSRKEGGGGEELKSKAKQAPSLLQRHEQQWWKQWQRTTPGPTGSEGSALGAFVRRLRA